MKTAGRENPNRWARAPRNRAHGAAGQYRSRSITWAAKQEKFQPQEMCFFLTSTFIERFSKFPCFTAWCSESISYVRVGCPILVQKAAIRKHLCNYCASRMSTVYHADGRSSRALTGASYGSGVRKLARPVTTSAFKSASVYLEQSANPEALPPVCVSSARHRRRMSSPFQTYGQCL